MKRIFTMRMFRYITFFAVSTSAFHIPTFTSRVKVNPLQMVRTRGLERRIDGATPKEGGFLLYIKAAEDGVSVGDCPFAHGVRMVLHEKGLDYDLLPSVQETKPNWLIEHYEGKLPALRHRKECYVESDVIMQYLDYFFAEPEMTASKALKEKTNEIVDGFFPAVAQYLKHTPDGDNDDIELKGNLEAALERLEDHLSSVESGDFLCGDQFTLQDCALAPKLYHMQTGINAFKNGSIDIKANFPNVNRYMDKVFGRSSFIDALYPEEVIVWGWGNARK